MTINRGEGGSRGGLCYAEAHGDKGLQPERTTLAWVRTSVLAVAVCILFARAVPGSIVLIAGISAACAVPAMTILATGRRSHRRRVDEFIDGGLSMYILAGISIGMSTVLLAVTAALMVAIEPAR
ncbi:DUF202 domain-containing protein [Rhodococcus opacus]|uniref:DUF202 domain-containing protein n=1 Tax=Rhodococcus opacus TaxID=37919 RepID=A0AAX3YTB0_RHOOP|nr:DUF202 domain-containing protein [Rhodococcus opacus]MCZ4589289.1 DUF202 domain-containing protein [Rhodococcus opacus]WLF51735.1 DUF202 domain-containing protein [Rhodococcus opacus]WLF52468.1 DUF202 domain-containing protein [Rhodococcus opacus]